MKKIIFYIFITLTFITYSCTDNSNEQVNQNISKSDTSSLFLENNRKNLLTDFVPLFDDGDINVVVEIPSGTVDKWEVDKTDGQVKWEMVDNKPRVVDYIGYPGNYGMIPQTILPKELGGDGDPLDVLVLGSPVERGTVIKCKLIGVLYLLDRGEQDDKLIAVQSGSSLYHVNSLEELDSNYIGISTIIQTWFTNYKGPNKMKSKGFDDTDKALEILHSAINEYKLKIAPSK